MHVPVGREVHINCPPAGRRPRHPTHGTRVETVQKVYCKICRRPFAKTPDYRSDICIRCLKSGERQRIHAPVGRELHRAPDMRGRHVTRGGW